ncbi:MAG: hypothetical protein K6C08_03390 [Oscillospiraceae bacterium]|nr:hypothetical protein [Oscillospiraceae bacterium]
MEKEILPGLCTDESGKHAFVRRGICSLTLPKQKGSALSGIRTLELPDTLESFAGLEQFRDLRAVRYAGSAEVFSFEEPLRWLGKNTGDLDTFTARLATNLLAFRPVPQTLCAVIAPKMRPIQAGEGWKRLLNALEERLKTAEEAGSLRQDGSREHVIICRSYTIFRHLQWCFSLGRALCGEALSAEAESGYGQEPVFTPEEQLSLLLASVQGHSYEEFSGVTGDMRVELMRDPQTYADRRKQQVRWREDEIFQRQLAELLEDGLVTSVNYGALLELLSGHGLTASTAIAIRYGSGHPELRAASPEEDFFL